jgi:cysteinyl-tRNA synthetase
MTEIRLHDTMAREKRVFEPADPARVTMYVCGPTVYNRAHIGNARPAVVFDVLARLLRHRYGEQSLVYARNVTDVDDKIIEAAETEGVEPSVITRRYEQHYLDDMGALGVGPPTLAPKATENVAEMIRMIARLIDTGNAYEADGHVLFHVPSDPGYGALGRRDREAMIAGARVEVASYKQDPADFVLWKPSAPGVIGWESPWGRGRPGWHIECSAMIERHLGTTIDIHGGGLDLIFPHHENEIAQSRCAHGGAPLARYWMHNGFLSMAGSDKMSKSLGNVVTVGELLQQGWKGEEIRYALLTAHYRQPLEWSEELLMSSRHVLEKYRRLVKEFRGFPYRKQKSSDLLTSLKDDLNTPAAISQLNQLYLEADAAVADTKHFYVNFSVRAGRDKQRHATKAFSRFYTLAKLLGLDALWRRDEQPPSFRWLAEAAIEARAKAKQRRDFSEADRIRAELAEDGILLEDSPAGTSWRRA